MGCAKRSLSPEPLPLDRVECARCRMLISTDSGGGEIVSATEDTRFYDDIGCLAADWEAHHGDARAYVRVAGGWRDAQAASFAQPADARTAMGSGVVAFAAGGRRPSRRPCGPCADVRRGRANVRSQEMMTHVWTIAQLELTAAVRLRWIRLLTVAFALLAAAAAYSAGAANEVSGAEGFARTTMALVPVVLILVPLAALILGVSGQASEPGSEPFLFGQPVSRATVLVGRWLGESVALSSSIVTGLGIGGAIVAFGSGADGLPRFVFFVLASVVLATIFLSIAAAIAAATEKRVVALGVATFAWFFFVLLYDGAALSLAGWLTGSAGGRILFGSVFGNPADLIRVVALSVSGTPNVLGAAGDAWVRFLGGTTGAAVAATAALAAWVVTPLFVGVRLIGARDL